MSPILVTVLISIAAFIVGGALCYIIFRYSSISMLRKAEEEAEIIKKNKIVEAKEKFIALKLEHDNQIRADEQRKQQREQQIQQREQQLNSKQGELQRQQNELLQKQQQVDNQVKALDYKAAEVEKMHKQAELQLEQLSGMSAEDAKKQLIEALKDEAKTDAMAYINETLDEARLTANKEAKKLIIQTIQRIASETTIENAVSVFHIDNEEVKGRVIGREGRNIRALEAATGVEIIVDDTPEAITISGYDPVRREIARLSLHQLVQDGRIHPARIEEVVAKVTKQVEDEIIETGKRTTIDLGVHGLHPELIRLVGKMKYRSSYGQNLLQHARETANLCGAMAAELGLNPKKARRAGLLHDIGKVAEEYTDLPHAEAGMKLCEQYGENPISATQSVLTTTSARWKPSSRQSYKLAMQFQVQDPVHAAKSLRLMLNVLMTSRTWRCPSQVWLRLMHCKPVANFVSSSALTRYPIKTPSFSPSTSLNAFRTK